MTLGGRRIQLACAVVAAGGLLALGISLPFLRSGKLLLLGYGAQEHSLISVVNALVRSDQLLLGSLLLLVGILLPLLRLLYLALLAALPPAEINRSAAPLRALAWLGCWSLYDLVALALAAAVVASQPALAQQAGPGAYCFAAAVLIMALAFAWLRSDGGALGLRALAAQVRAPRGAAFAVLVVLAIMAFVLGSALPIVRLSSGYAGRDVHSLASMIWALRARGDMLPWVGLLVLGVVLPALRLTYLLALLAATALPASVRTAAVLVAGAVGGYATADTMLLALMLLYLAVMGLADAALQPGVYCLAASAGLTLAAYAWANLATVAGSASGPRSSLNDRLAALAAAKEAGKT